MVSLVMSDLKDWVAGESIGFCSEEVAEVVARGVDVEYIGAMDLGVVGPEVDDMGVVGGEVVFVDEVSVNGAEFDHLRLGEHADEFDPGWADEGGVVPGPTSP